MIKSVIDILRIVLFPHVYVIYNVLVSKMTHVLNPLIHYFYYPQ